MDLWKICAWECFPSRQSVDLWTIVHEMPRLCTGKSKSIWMQIWLQDGCRQCTNCFNLFSYRRFCVVDLLLCVKLILFPPPSFSYCSTRITASPTMLCAHRNIPLHLLETVSLKNGVTCTLSTKTVCQWWFAESREGTCSKLARPNGKDTHMSGVLFRADNRCARPAVAKALNMSSCVSVPRFFFIALTWLVAANGKGMCEGHQYRVFNNSAVLDLSVTYEVSLGSKSCFSHCRMRLSVGSAILHILPNVPVFAKL